MIMEETELHPIKWDWKVVVFDKLLPRNRISNLDESCDQLDELNLAIDQIEQIKHSISIVIKVLIFITMPNCTLFCRCDRSYREVLPHFPYFPHFLPSNLHLFHFLQKFLEWIDLKRL